MLIDALGMLRAGGTTAAGAIEATEDGHDSKTRLAATGQAVIQIDKTAKKGLPIVAVYDADGINNRSAVLTIEACDLENFSSGVEVVATFPAVAATGKDVMIRRIHTQKKYIRSVITIDDGESEAGTHNFLVFAGIGLMNRG